MNILLIHPPARLFMVAYFRPIGLASVAQHLEDAGHYVEILDLNMLRPAKEEFPGVFPRLDFDMIGLSGLITTYRVWYDMMPLLRETYPNALFVGGGAGISSAPEEYMTNLGLDIGVLGEGEYTAVELAAAIENGTDLGDVLGLIYREDGELKRTPARPLEKDLDKIYKQAYHLLPMEYYARVVKHSRGAAGELAMLGTRGCPYSCSYCWHIFDNSWRHRSVRNIVDELELLERNWGTNAAIFGDECLTINKQFVLDLCDEIVARGLKIQWNCFSRVNTIDEEMVLAMKKAGCWLIGFGLETGSQKILDAMNKKATVEQAREVWSMIRAIPGMHPKATMMYGHPGETLETIEETIQFCKDLTMFGNTYYTTPYPGTRIFDKYKDRILKRYGTLHNFFMALDDATKFSINLTEMDLETFFFARFRMLAICTLTGSAKILKQSTDDSFAAWMKLLEGTITKWS